MPEQQVPDGTSESEASRKHAVATVTSRHAPWTHETRSRKGPWRLALLRTGCDCGWTGPEYDLHDTAAGIAYDEAVWAHQDHLDTDADRE
ncbi:MAG: hypothetical protein ACRCYX_05705 [Dermatophilaceae bacterium]